MPDLDELADLAVPSHQRLLELSGQDPWVRYGIPAPLPGLALHLDGALLVQRRHPWIPRRRGLVGLGPERALDELLALAVAADLPAAVGARSLSVPQELSHVPPHHLALDEGARWDWLWTTRCPPQHPREHQVVELDDVLDAERIVELSRAHSPSAEGEPGTGRSERWAGVQQAGRLVAAGAAQRPEGAAAHLAGIVVADSVRGQGYGGAVTAWLTRAAVARDGVCTLGVYAGNDAALRLYRRLGYRVGHCWHSRTLSRG